MGTQKYILVQSSDPPGGLHCLNLENGEEKWWFDTVSRWRGHTPAVDQSSGWVYYMCNARLFKINALTGAQLDYAALSNPSGSGTGSGNTVLIDDGHGYFIACAVNDYVAYGGAVKVFDSSLDLVWEDTGLNMNLKTVMAYNDGVLYCGKGNAFAYPEILAWYAGDKEDCTIKAYDITDGTVLWEYECDAAQDWNSVIGGNRGFIEVIYCNGYIIANTVFQDTTEIYIINATNGTLVKKLTDETDAHSACGPSVLSGGRLYVPSLQNDTIRVYQLGTGTFEDWNTYGSTPQLNHNVANSASLATIAETPAYVNEVIGGDQGGIIIDSVAYFIKNTNCVKFNPDTLVVADNFDDIGSIYDSTPLMVKNLADSDVLLIKESANARVIAINPITGDRIWNSTGNMPGNLFFGMNYYVSSFTDVIGEMTSAEILTAINGSFTTLNTLIADAATIITITSAVQWDDINANITSLNTEGVAVDVDTITIGMIGTEFNDIINDFVVDYNLANS